MASDASRRWLDDSGILSCRIKLPQSLAQSHALAQAQADNARAVAENIARSQFALDMASSTDFRSMDVPLQSTSPNARRNNEGEFADAAIQMQNMQKLNHGLDTLRLPSDPDAQATVTDFLDFTEYLPSDMIRSLTLIGNLDHQYSEASIEVHDLTKMYGQLPSLPAETKPDPTSLRAAISQNLGEAIGARTASYAEACRMLENVERHYSRIKNIHAKLQLIADTYPPSRDPSPTPLKNRSPAVNRPPKITLRVGGGAADGGANKVRKHRPPRITVPGEVLAPYELDYESWGSDSDESSDDQFVTPRETPSRTLAGNKIRLKVPKQRKDRAPKPPRDNRPPGFGTNVHSMIAGISTSNALKLLQPPPPDAKPGSEHLPWLALSEYELGHLRKKMKKNAVWSPSDTMINRELKVRGRGLEAYRAAVAEAAAKGETIEVPPQLSGQNVTDKGALSAEAANKSLEEEAPLMNRGMKLNEAKKLKRENQKKELEAAEDGFEEAMRKVENAKTTIENLFSAGDKFPAKEKKGTVKTPSRTPARKRKREPEADAEGDADKAAGASSVKPARPLLKRSKTETPVPVPQSIAAKQATPASEATPSVVSETTQATIQVSTPAATPIEAPAEPAATPLPVPAPSPKKSITPILPPVRASKKNVRSELKKIETPTATSERPHRGAAAAIPVTPVAPITVPLPVPPPIATPTPEALPAKRPTSSRSKAASVEREVATATTDRPRRTSTARNTPAPEPQRQPSKRTKRPAPGIVTKNSGDSTAVSVGKRSAATRKKAGPKKEKKDGREGSAAQEIFDEVDDEGNIIDPDEPRYCLCNRVSFGTMIGCESHDCEKEWFHLECVGLTEIPPRTTKWYCPECRITLRIGEKGEVNARGKKK
ncbi:FYVE zinc finger [Venustampulla echinocandica]|uniref:FYVE zinc finger n=1 Tax=Venustampulla echinocandica TaxID=2656787 RepID=A0A370TYY3_9HELO|nr:FYVE zinc finger [Venustampulla echinocandica]RDL40736.1 FYVE zinc finger [Venustampulla echinocandica]